MTFFKSAILMTLALIAIVATKPTPSATPSASTLPPAYTWWNNYQNCVAEWSPPVLNDVKSAECMCMGIWMYTNQNNYWTLCIVYNYCPDASKNWDMTSYSAFTVSVNDYCYGFGMKKRDAKFIDKYNQEVLKARQYFIRNGMSNEITAEFIDEFY